MNVKMAIECVFVSEKSGSNLDNPTCRSSVTADMSVSGLDRLQQAKPISFCVYGQICYTEKV